MSLETRQNPWWLLLMAGILKLLIGILLLTSPVKTTLAFVWVLGVYWFVEGIFILVGMFTDRSAWGWKLFMGAISILAGLAIMRQPIVSAVAIPAFLVLVLGIQGIVTGIVSLLLAFKGGGWGAAILGILNIIFGIILILNWTNPATILVFIWVVAILAIAGGLAEIFMAFRQR